MARRRRVVKRTMTRIAATEVRHRIEGAQEVCKLPTPPRSDQRGVIRQARAQATLDRYGVTVYENVTQSQHRVARYWRVYADPS